MIKWRVAELVLIRPMLRSLLVVSLSCTPLMRSSADAAQIRVSVSAQAEHGDDARMVSALSREFRKMDGLLVTDTEPGLKVTCVLIRLSRPTSGSPVGYAASVAVTTGDDHLITHLVQTHETIETLAHEIAVIIDGSVFEPIRRAPRAAGSP